MARPAGGTPKKGKKNRKHGRNKTFCEQYARENRREKNKRKTLIRHVKDFPNDFVAAKALKAI